MRDPMPADPATLTAIVERLRRYRLWDRGGWPLPRAAINSDRRPALSTQEPTDARD